MHLRLLLLPIIALLLLACAPEGYEIVRKAEETGPPEEVIVTETVERVYNCGLGGDTLYLTPSQVHTLAQSVFWEFGIELEVEPPPLRLIPLSAELETTYGEGYEISTQTGTGWQLPARPGEWLEYTIRWSEVWHKGDVIQKVGNRQETVKYRYRKAIKTEITDKKLLDCEDEVILEEPVEEVEPAATPAPEVAEAATPIPSPVASPAPSAEGEYTVIVSGFGLAPADMTNPGQRRRAALLAAEMDAKRKLAEWLAGAEIASVTIVENSQISHDTIRQEIRSHLQGVKILSQSYDEESGQAEVTIQVVLEHSD